MRGPTLTAIIVKSWFSIGGLEVMAVHIALIGVKVLIIIIELCCWVCQCETVGPGVVLQEHLLYHFGHLFSTGYIGCTFYLLPVLFLLFLKIDFDFFM